MIITMKKSIIAIALLSIICCGCKEHERNEEMTLRGKAICDVWFNATKCVLENMVAPSFRLEEWINADDSLKPAIEQRLFQHKHVRQFGEGTGIYEILDNNVVLYSVNTYHKSISDPDAEWEVTTYPPYSGQDYYSVMPEFVYTDSFNVITIKHTEAQQWLINGNDNKLAGSTINLLLTLPTIPVIPGSADNKTLTLKGDGAFMYSGHDFEDASKESPVTLHFDIAEQLIPKTLKLLKWERGVVDFTASKNGCEDVKASVTYQDDQLIIRYRDISEAWDN